nr:hypothetical protein [Planosporangium flavigriseum]
MPPEDFVAARDVAAKRAKAAGDRRLAAEIAKLRRPTVGAWAVNRLARQRPELMAELIELGEALRSAQRDLRGEELRELSIRRRAAVAGLVREAIQLAGRGNLPAAEIEATLAAALADPVVAEQVRAGRLARTVAYAGFGETPRPKLRLIQGGEEQQAGTKEAAAKEAGTEEAAAKAAAEKAAAEKAAAAERRAAERAAAAARRGARAAAHRELLAARTELAEAEAARALAERRVTAARRRIEKAEAVLDGLETDQ